MSDLRIFSYAPNPRLYKATIAARYSGATIEIVGAKPTELPNWLWDYDAREVSEEQKAAIPSFARTAKRGFRGTLYKSDAFLQANPFGDVPAGFGKDGQVGLFESNSIMRAAARMGPNGPALYDNDPLEASRIDSFLDKTLLFARDVQVYLLGGREDVTQASYDAMSDAFHSYMSAIDRALGASSYLGTGTLSLADVAFACEVCLLGNEKNLLGNLKAAGLAPLVPEIQSYPAASKHLVSLLNMDTFAQDLAPYAAKLDLGIAGQE
jgi:elongation factor 1-gamma